MLHQTHGISSWRNLIRAISVFIWIKCSNGRLRHYQCPRSIWKISYHSFTYHFSLYRKRHKYTRTPKNILCFIYRWTWKLLSDLILRWRLPKILWKTWHGHLIQACFCDIYFRARQKFCRENHANRSRFLSWFQTLLKNLLYFLGYVKKSWNLEKLFVRWNMEKWRSSCLVSPTKRILHVSSILSFYIFKPNAIIPWISYPRTRR